MFGFLRGSRCHRVFRQSYARICQVQRHLAGITATPFLSYESVFLYLTAIDAGLIPAPPADAPGCCRLRRRANWQDEPDAAVAEFCVAVALLLVQTKLEDDVRDAGYVTARLGLKWYAKAIQRSHRILNRSQPALVENLRRRIDEHLHFEQASSLPALGDYARPTALAFGELFAALPGHVGLAEESLPATFRQLGEDVGEAIITFDCAADWWRDAQRGEFNPVRNRAAADAAMQQAADVLLRAGWRCSDQFGPQSETARLLRSRWAALENRTAATDAACRERLESAGLTREPGYTYAYCDGCDCGGCDGGGCDGGANAAGDCGQDCDCNGPKPGRCDGCNRSCCLDGCCGCTDCCLSPKSSSPKKSDIVDGDLQSAGDLVGQEGVTLTKLIPTGFVMINQRRYPARSAIREVAAEQRVRVVSQNSFGLVVESLSP